MGDSSDGGDQARAQQRGGEELHTKGLEEKSHRRIHLRQRNIIGCFGQIKLTIFKNYWPHIPYTIYHKPYTIYHIPYTIHHIPYTVGTPRMSNWLWSRLLHRDCNFLLPALWIFVEKRVLSRERKELLKIFWCQKNRNFSAIWPETRRFGRLSGPKCMSHFCLLTQKERCTD